MTISEANDGESAVMDNSDSTNKTEENPFADVTYRQFFTSTPYLGYGYPHLPPITSIYSPFATYYDIAEGRTRFTFDPSTSSSPIAESSAETRSDQYSPPPRLLPNTTRSANDFSGSPYVKKSFTSVIKSDSGISSSSSLSSGTPITRNVVRGYKKTYCSVCKMHINKDGKRSQGPRRHLLQYHVRRPLFQCPHCTHASFYDKFHVTSHMRRIHQDNSERLVNRSSEFEEEVEEWYEKCFGERKNSGKSAENELCQNPPSPTQSSPPPVLTPEAPIEQDQENIDPMPPPGKCALMETPLKAPLKKRKMGFMIEDILQLNPKKAMTSPLTEKLNL